ncbi:MAG: YitT family protein [Tyzzerella sp.]|nr:YitT family protein [Tyzzerella sp.]
MKAKYKEELKNIFNPKKLFMVILGNTIYSLGVVAFILPLGLITGGTTGLGLIANHYFNIPIEVFAAIFNVLMFVIAWFTLGTSFAFTTMISTFYYPTILAVLQKVEALKTLTTDLMLATICAGLLIGFGIGIVIRAGASTGGVDIPPLVLNKKLGIPISVGLYACDFAILIGQMFFRDHERTLYGILLVLVYTVVMDKVLLSGKSKVEVKIISKYHEQINKAIQEKVDRGTTFLKIETGYLREDTKALMTVVSNRELPKLNQIVMDIDPKAFMVINEAKEVMGQGFTTHKNHVAPNEKK